jgi:hypothetical protein
MQDNGNDQEMYLICGIGIGLLIIFLVASWLSGLLFWHNIFE